MNSLERNLNYFQLVIGERALSACDTRFKTDIWTRTQIPRCHDESLGVIFRLMWSFQGCCCPVPYWTASPSWIAHCTVAALVSSLKASVGWATCLLSHLFFSLFSLSFTPIGRLCKQLIWTHYYVSLEEWPPAAVVIMTEVSRPLLALHVKPIAIVVSFIHECSKTVTICLLLFPWRQRYLSAGWHVMSLEGLLACKTILRWIECLAVGDHFSLQLLWRSNFTQVTLSSWPHSLQCLIDDES